MRDDSSPVNDWISRSIAGDRAAIESLLVHFHDPLLGFIRTSITPRESADVTADDVLQQTMIEVFRSIRQFRPEGESSFFAWVKTIARTRHLNLQSARRAAKRGGGRQPVGGRRSADDTATSILNLIAGHEPSPSLVLRRREAVDVVTQALSALNPERRHVIELRYGQGLSIAQVAAKLGKGEGAVKMQIHRAIQEIRQIILVDFKEFTAGA
jgi:RNA polymerase sigma-70 factor, ECF subfamily